MIKTPFTHSLYKAFGLKKQKKEHFKNSIEGQYFQFENPRDANPHPDMKKLQELASNFIHRQYADIYGEGADWGRHDDPNEAFYGHPVEGEERTRRQFKASQDFRNFMHSLRDKGHDITDINETILHAFEDTGYYYPPDEGRPGGYSGDADHNPASQLFWLAVPALLEGGKVPWHTTGPDGRFQPYVSKEKADPLAEHADMYNTYKLIQETNPDYQIPGFEVGGKYEQYMQPPPKQLADPKLIEGQVIKPIEAPKKLAPPKESNLDKMLRKAFCINKNA